MPSWPYCSAHMTYNDHASISQNTPICWIFGYFRLWPISLIILVIVSHISCNESYESYVGLVILSDELNHYQKHSMLVYKCPKCPQYQE